MNTIGYHLRKYLLPSIQGRGRGVGLLFCLFIISCSQESVPTYDTSESRLNIWVGTAAGIVYESVSYNYSYAYEEGTVPFYAQITGVPADHDRTFRLEPFGPAAAQVAPTVRVEDFVIKAGAIGGTFQLHLNTQLLPDPSLFTEKEDTVRFRMVPNDEFLLGTEKHQEFTIIVKNFLSKPDNWDRVPTRNDMLIFKPLKDFFGDYSRVKYQFMIQVLGLIDFQIQASMGSLPSYVEETNTVSATYANQLVQKMQQALAEYNATHDTPLTDEYGYPVTF